MEPRTSAARSVSVERVAVVEVAVIEIVVVEVVAINDGSAVRDVGVVIVDYPVAMPVASPVMPAPTISSEEADSKSNPEGNYGTGKKDSGHRIPAWISNDRLAVHEPRIIGRHVHDFRVGRFDDNCVALSCYLFLFVAIQLASFLSTLAHHLDGIRDILLLIGVCITKG